MPRHEERTCPRCGGTFECRAGSALICDCAGVELTDEQRAEIRGRYTDCLCVGCLKELGGHDKVG